MQCDSCHNISWLRERPSLVRLQGQLASSIRILEVALLWIQLFTGFTLTDHDNWHIDDREHCLQGRSIVMISMSANGTAPIDRLFTLEVVLSDHGDWRIDDREHCLRGRSIVMIGISVNVIVPIRLHCCLCARTSPHNVTSFHNVNIFNTFSTAYANGIGVRLFFHTENSTGFLIHCSTVPYWAGARPGLGRLESLRPAKVCMNRSTHVRYWIEIHCWI